MHISCMERSCVLSSDSSTYLSATNNAALHHILFKTVSKSKESQPNREMSVPAVSSQMSKWSGSILSKCDICYSTHQNGTINKSRDYLQRVIESCAETLFLEITGEEFDWSLISCNQVMPFCQSCWQSIEKLYKLNEQKEPIENSIENIVKELGVKILSNRRYLKKKGILSTSKTNPVPASFGHGIKIEGFSLNQNIQCRMCHNVYGIDKATDPLPLDISGKVMECCELHLFPELIDEHFFDWNSIPFNNFVPFCEDCCQYIKNIMDLDEKLRVIESFITSHVDAFTLNVLKCRKSLKQMGQRGFQDDSSIPASNHDQDLIDLDEDCKILSVANVYPNNFLETSLQEPTPEQDMEQPNQSAPSTTTSDDIMEDETMPVLHPESSRSARCSHSSDSDVAPPNSVETFISPTTPTHSSTLLNMTTNISVQGDTGRNVPVFPAALKLPKNERIIVQTSGTMFKCQTCGRIFIFRKSWEAHAVECTKQSPSLTSEVKTCCGQSFSNEESWNVHQISHRARSFTSPQSKTSNIANPSNSTKTGSQSQSPEHLPLSSHLQFLCNYCDKVFKTKRGLSLHTRSHTKLDAYKCRECSIPFGYRCQLEKHQRIVHPEKYNNDKSKSDSTSNDSSSENRLPLISKKKKRNFSCRFCPMPVSSQRELTVHAQSHYSIAIGCRCEICKTVFSSKKTLKFHNGTFHKHLV